MLIIVPTFLSCINAVDPLGKMIGSVAETFYQTVRVSGNHPNAPVIASIPDITDISHPKNLLFNHRNHPLLNFREAIHGNSMKESKIIKYFASKYYNDPKLQQETYQDIINYITRDLGQKEISDFQRILNLELFFNNAKETKTVNLDLYDMHQIFEYGKLDLLKYFVGKEIFHQFKDFRYLPYTLAAQNGHIQMVKWILEKNPSSESYKRMIGTSIHQNQKPTFTAILEMLTKKA